MSKSYLDTPVSPYLIPSQDTFINQSSPQPLNPALQSFLSLNFDLQKDKLKSSPSLLSLSDATTGNSLLHLSVQNENYNLTEMLIEYNADINSRNILEQTALHLAIQTENHKIINLLLEKNADPNVRDINGETPMHIAAYNGDYKVIKLLLLFKADIYIMNNNKMYPIDYAKETGHKKCFDVLIKASEKNKNTNNISTVNNNNYMINITTSPCNDGINNLSTITNTPFMNYVNSYTNSNSTKKHRNIHSAYYYPSHHFLSEDNSINNNRTFNVNNNNNKSTLSNQNEISGIYNTESPMKPQLRLIPEEKNQNAIKLTQNLNSNFNTARNTESNTKRLYIKKIIGRNFSNDNLSNRSNKTTTNSTTNAVNNTFVANTNRIQFEENNINTTTITNEQTESIMISHSNINNNFPWYVNDNGGIVCKAEVVNQQRAEVLEGEEIRVVHSEKNDIVIEQEVKAPVVLNKNNTLRSSKTRDENSYAYEEIDNFIKGLNKETENESSEDDEIIVNDDDDDAFQIVEPSTSSIETKTTTAYNQRASLLPLPDKKNLKQDLFSFLKEIEMEEYTNQFFNEGFDDIKLILNQMKSGFGITDGNLKEVGIMKPGDRARILIRLQELSNGFDFNVPFNVVYYRNKKDFKDVKYDFHVKAMMNWLRELKMEKYLEKFYNNGYHSMELIYIQMVSVCPFGEKILEEEIGISKIGYRTRILNKIKEDSDKFIEKLRQMKFEISNRSSINQTTCKCVIF